MKVTVPAIHAPEIVVSVGPGVPTTTTYKVTDGAVTVKDADLEMFLRAVPGAVAVEAQGKS